MEIERIIGQPPSVGRLKESQVAQQSTWTQIPENKRIMASQMVIHVYPKNGSTETVVNPTDPGDGCYLERPYPPDRVVPAGRI